MSLDTKHKFVVMDITDGINRASEHCKYDTREEAVAEIEWLMKIRDGQNWKLTIWETWELA